MTELFAEWWEGTRWRFKSKGIPGKRNSKFKGSHKPNMPKILEETSMKETI